MIDSFDPPGSTDDGASVVFRDALFLMMLGMVAVIFLINLLINPESDRKQEIPIHGEVVITAFWPSGSSYDVDLWVMGPDKIPVGWGQHETTAAVNLERDDRGEINDASEVNYEMISVRERMPGEYIVNVHLYNPYSEPLPVPVTVNVVGKEDLGEIYSGVSEINERPREITVVRFALGDDGRLVPGSVKHTPINIVPARSPFGGIGTGIDARALER